MGIAACRICRQKTRAEGSKSPTIVDLGTLELTIWVSNHDNFVNMKCKGSKHFDARPGLVLNWTSARFVFSAHLTHTNQLPSELFEMLWVSVDRHWHRIFSNKERFAFFWTRCKRETRSFRPSFGTFCYPTRNTTAHRIAFASHRGPPRDEGHLSRGRHPSIYRGSNLTQLRLLGLLIPLLRWRNCHTEVWCSVYPDYIRSYVHRCKSLGVKRGRLHTNYGLERKHRVFSQSICHYFEFVVSHSGIRNTPLGNLQNFLEHREELTWLTRAICSNEANSANWVSKELFQQVGHIRT